MGIYPFPLPILHVTIVEFWPSLTKVLWFWVKMLRKWQPHGMELGQSQGDVGRFGWQVLEIWEVGADRRHQHRQGWAREAFSSHSFPLSKLLAKGGRRGEGEFQVGSAPIGSFQNLLQNTSVITNRQVLFLWPQEHTWRQKCGGSEERHMVG